MLHEFYFYWKDESCIHIPQWKIKILSVEEISSCFLIFYKEKVLHQTRNKWAAQKVGTIPPLYHGILLMHKRSLKFVHSRPHMLGISIPKNSQHFAENFSQMRYVVRQGWNHVQFKPYIYRCYPHPPPHLWALDCYKLKFDIDCAKFVIDTCEFLNLPIDRVKFDIDLILSNHDNFTIL